MIKSELSRNQVNRENILKIKAQIKQQIERLAEHSVKCQDIIEKHATNVIRDGMTILVHSLSKCVLEVLKKANDRGIRINIITTISEPFGTGRQVQDEMDKIGIPCKTILDSAVGLSMHQVDCVFVGAEAVLENGGIVNRVGTFTIALCAKSYNKPFYVFAESLKFLKFFPLQQSDVFNIVDDG